jgi:hypothetical protein
MLYGRGSTTRGVPPSGGSSGGGEFLYERDIYLFWTKYGSKIKNIYILVHTLYFGTHFAWLKYFTHHLVPVMAPNYNQHIFSPAEDRKVCYSLAELYVRSVYLNVFLWRGRDVHETIRGAQDMKLCETLLYGDDKQNVTRQTNSTWRLRPGWRHRTYLDRPSHITSTVEQRPPIPHACTEIHKR